MHPHRARHQAQRDENEDGTVEAREENLVETIEQSAADRRTGNHQHGHRHQKPEVLAVREAHPAERRASALEVGPLDGGGSAPSLPASPAQARGPPRRPDGGRPGSAVADAPSRPPKPASAILATYPPVPGRAVAMSTPARVALGRDRLDAVTAGAGRRRPALPWGPIPKTPTCI